MLGMSAERKFTFGTYSFSGETEVAFDLGFEYAVLPQVGVTAICCLCNLRGGKKKRERGKKNMKEVG